MAKIKFYAVAVGRLVGVFDSWNVCEQQVKGFRGAVYKSFPTQQEASDYVAKNRKAQVIDWKPDPVRIQLLTNVVDSSDGTGRHIPSSSLVARGTRDMSSLSISQPDEAQVTPPTKKRKLVPILTKDDDDTKLLPTMNSKKNPFTDSSNDLSFLVHFDGGSRGNPGIAGCGAHIVVSRTIMNSHPNHKKSTFNITRSNIHIHRYLRGSQTNNQAEYWGLISGLESVLENLQQQFTPGKKPKLLRRVKLTVQGDSKLIIQQMTGKWKVGSILESAHRKAVLCRDQIKDLCRVNGASLEESWSHVYRSDNKEADECANLAMDLRKSWVVYKDIEGVETQKKLSDVVPE